VTTFELEPPRATFATPPCDPPNEVLAAATTLREYASNQKELSLIRQQNCYSDPELRNLVYEYRGWCWLQAQCERVLAPVTQ
jgi:hypothetical protein